MANFKGFKQVFLSTYNGLTEDEKKGYLWLVRESAESDSPSAIYFGTRKYAVNNPNEAEAIEEKITNIVNTLGDVVDANGEWVGFLPIEEHELIGSATTMTEALTAIENAILENKDAIAAVEAALEDKVDTEAFNAKVAELEEEIENAGKVKDVIVNGVSVMSGDTAVIDLTGVEGDVETLKTDVEAVKEDIQEVKESLNTKASNEDLTNLANLVNSAVTDLEEIIETKADADNVYTKDEVDSMVARTFKFKGDAEAISTDETVITVNGGEITASENNIGFVYQLGDAEYASNGEKWIKLGFNIDLSEYATKDELTEVGNSKVEKTIVGTNGTAEIFNEADGGGAHFTQNDGSESFVGVNDGSNDGLMAQIYADKLTDEGTWSGSRINVYNDKITYQSKESTDAGIAKNSDELEIVVKKDLNEVEERVEALENVSTVTALTYTDALELDLANGQIVYVSNSEEGESGHTSGAYIKVGDNLKKLDTSTGDGQTLADRVDTLENTVGNTALPDGKTLTSAVSELLDDKIHEIDGDDVEE